MDTEQHDCLIIGHPERYSSRDSPQQTKLIEIEIHPQNQSLYSQHISQRPNILLSSELLTWLLNL